jgi:hypothetical protein
MKRVLQRFLELQLPRFVHKYLTHWAEFKGLIILKEMLKCKIWKNVFACIFTQLSHRKI